MAVLHNRLIFFFFICCTLGQLSAAKKNVLVIYGDSTHNKHAHNNEEVAALLKYKLDHSAYADHFEVNLHYGYPDDQSVVERADLIIISCDGGPKHALKKGDDVTIFTRMLDPVLKRRKTGLIVIHWATDAPSKGFAQLHEENARYMMEWIGAVYYWVDRGNSHKSCFTIKPSLKKITVNKTHPIANGVAETFDLQDEFYWNFFTEGEDSRNPKNDAVSYIHLADAPGSRADADKKETWRKQSPYWAFTRANQGRSVGMTSAHNYATWANPDFFQTFANSVFWTMDMPIPKDGVDISTPTKQELSLMMKQVAENKAKKKARKGK
jgi:hypothetical protein